jgi:hypothetical protein
LQFGVMSFLEQTSMFSYLDSVLHAVFLYRGISNELE